MGQFNSDTSALINRAELNKKGAAHDLEAWILDHLPSLQGKRVLDLGCGAGKQLFRFAPLVGAEGKMVGIDLSEDAVRIVNQRAKEEGFPFVEARQMSLDECLDKLQGETFDIVVSSYAIYYASDVVGLIEGLKKILNEKACMFICGPGNGTNKEMLELVERLEGTPVERVDNFLTDAQVAALNESFSTCEMDMLENYVMFDSPEAVMIWWENHNSYRPEVADKVREALHEHFKTHDTYKLTKNVFGVKLDA